ncbi:hypothetical protein SAMN05421743_10882 [Thalassobacillus cyri]|uniref:Uncharacterized protein n=1 Tax=Thalassobacillus cyri TaxID=571932 RepID=A0A1H4E132_9BACI|nr:hypothetical protein [Thalassobacillus cyri]SEA78458.1 hypothetical protein SAMN05421743_10882 [Thalassobacillus cyri]
MQSSWEIFDIATAFPIHNNRRHYVLEENKAEVAIEDLEVVHRILDLKDKPSHHLGEQNNELTVEK